MFIGTVQCEIELASSHPAFKGYRFLLVEAEHEVEWEGAVVAIDLVDAQVGDLVMTALAPLGAEFDLPADLPIDGAVVGIVGTITTPAEEEEEDTGDRRRRRAPAEAPRPRPVEAPRAEVAREEEPVAEERPRRREGKEPRREEAREPRREEREGRREEREPRRDERAERAPRPPRREEEEPAAPAPERSARRPDPIEEEAEDDLQIVWDAPESGETSVGGAKKRTRRRRR